MTIVIFIVCILTNIPRAIQLTDRGINNTEGSCSANASTETIPEIKKQTAKTVRTRSDSAQNPALHYLDLLHQINSV